MRLPRQLFGRPVKIVVTNGRLVHCYHIITKVAVGIKESQQTSYVILVVQTS